MAITNAELNVGVLETIRDTLRTDSSLLTILGITTLEAKNHIFSKQPASQVKGFDNPRIIVYHVNYSPNDIGSNSDGFQEKEIEFQVSAWVDNTTGWSDSVKLMERITILLDDTDFEVTGSITAKGRFEVVTANAEPDPEKENTDLVRVLARARTNISR